MRALRGRGMSVRQMSRQVGVPADTLQKIDVGLYRGVRRHTYNKIAKLRYEPPVEHFRGAEMPLFPVERRIRALLRAGFTLRWMADQSGISMSVLGRILNGQQKYVHAVQVEKIRLLYRELDLADPLDYGISEVSKRRAILKAERMGCPPRGCWDPDTIDDPDAQPEWTGECGTQEGRQIHAREKIPVCPACLEFRLELDPNADLGRRFSGEKFKAVRLGRGMTQAGMEKMAGLSIGQTHHWESGRNVPRMKSLAKALTVLEADYDDVCE